MKYNKGYRFNTKNSLGCYECEVISIEETGWRLIVFINHNHIVKTHISAIKRGDIKNPFHPSVVNVGYIGVGSARVSVGGLLTNEYKVWVAMLKRIHSPNSKSSSYTNVSISTEWYNFNTFAKWHDENNYCKGDELDKDLLQINVKSKIYSPSTCIYIPSVVNNFIRKIRSDNTSGVNGLSFDKSKRSWIVRKTDFHSKKRIYIGSFKDKNKAIDSAINANKSSFNSAIDYLRYRLDTNIINNIKLSYEQ